MCDLRRVENLKNSFEERRTTILLWHVESDTKGNATNLSNRCRFSITLQRSLKNGHLSPPLDPLVTQVRENGATKTTHREE
jgi:hypothetical protein